MPAGAMRAAREILRRRAISAVLMSLAAGLCVLPPSPQAALAASRGASSISAGGFHSCAIENGKAYCWGSNQYGQLGDGSTAESTIPVAVDTRGVLAGKILTQIAAGYDDTCAVDSAGAAYCWGRNYDGELGDGSTAESTIPVAVDVSGVLAGKTLTQITAEGGHGDTCVLDSTGAAYCWGAGGTGDLGDGSIASSSVPVAVDAGGVLAGKTLTQIAGYGDDTCVLDSAGAAYCWGFNYYGELGDGSSGDSSDSSVPVAVDASGVLAGKTLTQITAGEWQTCAVDTVGTAYCWGYNAEGQLGDGTTNDSSVPVAVDSSGVLAGKTLTQITAGWVSTCALGAGGTAYCWGDNYYGELGDGNTAESTVPVAVDTSGALAGKTLTQITGGDAQHTCAVDVDGAAYCWGDNTYGELGDDSSGVTSDMPMLAGPAAPTGLTAVPGDTTAAVSWTAPASLDGGTLTGYTATAAPGGETCTTGGATACTITGLANGTAYSVTVVVHTTAGDSGSSAPANVTPGSEIAFTSDSADTVTFGVAFRFTVTTTGSPAAKITKTGRLPSGVTFTAHSNGTATIAGTPANAAAGVYPLTLSARNKHGTATQAFTLIVIRAPALKKIPATTAAAGVSLNLAITTTGYPAPALTESGSLPAGLSFTDNGNGTAAIAGTPAAGSGGRYSITVTATNMSGSTSKALTLTVKQQPAITSADTATAITGSAFTFHVTATGFPVPKITESGRLPKGVHFKSGIATFSGTPKAGTSRSYQVTITARNNSGIVAQNFTLTVT